MFIYIVSSNFIAQLQCEFKKIFVNLRKERI